jgi:hypothetical protein
MKTLLAVAAVAAGLLGCGKAPNEYSVRLDPTLTPEQSERVLAALDEWGQKTGLVYRTNFSPDHCGDFDGACVHVEFISDAQAQTRCVGQHHMLGCQIPAGMGGSNVYLTELDSGGDAYALALHELGHAWGLAHDTGNSVMQANIDYAAHDVTDRDVAQFDRVHGF